MTPKKWPKYELGDIVFVYQQHENFSVVSISEDGSFFRVKGLVSNTIMRVNSGAITGKLIKYHDLWNKICLK